MSTIIPLRSAVLCLSCDAISNERGPRCPACGNVGIFGIANFIGSMNPPRGEKVQAQA
jgi:hypothetical protein